VNMTEWSKVSEILDEIRAQESILDVSLISRGGMYIMGDPPGGVHHETFAAMSAIIMGAAETTSSELRDSLNKVVIMLAEKDLVLTSAGPKYMIAIALRLNNDVNATMREAREKISRLEKNL